MTDRIRNLEISFPRFEVDGLRFLTFGSAALGWNRGEVTLYVPPDAEARAPAPVVVLLHGVLGSHWSWVFNGGAHKTAAEMIARGLIDPMVLAMPSDGLGGQGTGYLKLESGDFESWIVEDVLAGIEAALPFVSSVSPRFLTGFSMGGYGALRLGAKFPRRFQGISGMSSITHYDQMAEFVEPPQVPDDVNQEELSVFYWIARNRDILPPLRFDCGKDDKLIEPNRALHRDLDREGIAHGYVEYEGRHSWGYWEEHLSDTLLFFQECLRQEGSPE